MLADSDLARANRGYLRGLYANVKYADAHMRFSFITGVSKFSKVSLFSGLNNLTDLTIDPQYSAICGYTEADNDIANYEGYDASVFYSYFAGLGLDVTVEDSTSLGRLDMALRFQDRVYLFEFKVVEQAGEGSAMAQLKARRYADKYRASGPVRLVGVEFSSESRNIVSFEIGWGDGGGGGAR